jgi:hypothetical protein
MFSLGNCDGPPVTDITIRTTTEFRARQDEAAEAIPPPCASGRCTLPAEVVTRDVAYEDTPLDFENLRLRPSFEILDATVTASDAFRTGCSAR